MSPKEQRNGRVDRNAGGRGRQAGTGARLLAGALALSLASLAQAQTTIDTPSVSGDQLLFFYDAREGRVPFLSVSNPSDSPVEIAVAFYPASLVSRVGTASFTVPPAGNVVIDPTSADVAGGAANGNAGLAVVTPVASGTTQATVPPKPLTGGFTLANTTLAAAFGENAFGRLAVNGSGQHASAGATVNGSPVRYQRFAPEVLEVPVHFNPQTLAQASDDGNRIVLASFTDQYGAQFDVAPATDNAPAVFFDASGFEVATGTAAINGVLLTDLQALAGATTLAKSGKVFIDVTPGSGNVFGIFSQSLGTFASGQRMPAVSSVPTGLGPPPSPSPTPIGGPTPTPGGGGSVTCSGSVSLTIAIGYDATSVPNLAGATTDIGYPSSVSIPGVNADPSVVNRVTNLTAVSGGLFQVGDDDTTLSVGLVSLSQTIPSGNFARAKFDCTSGASISASAFTCQALGSDNLGLDVALGCTLVLAAP